jgi:hypothetical protein
MINHSTMKIILEIAKCLTGALLQVRAKIEVINNLVNSVPAIASYRIPTENTFGLQTAILLTLFSGRRIARLKIKTMKGPQKQQHRKLLTFSLYNSIGPPIKSSS